MDSINNNNVILSKGFIIIRKTKCLAHESLYLYLKYMNVNGNDHDHENEQK